MIISFLTQCFLVGLFVSAIGGPIFMLTFKQSSLYGFWHGFATALGSSLVDGILFTLGLLGALSFITNSKIIIMSMDALGGILLISLGIHTLKYPPTLNQSNILYESLYLSTIRSFLLTLLNPGVAFFFMIVIIKFFDEATINLSINQMLMGGLSVFLGSLTTLSCVSLAARRIDNFINERKIRIVSIISGLLFIGAGAYFFFDFIKNAFHSVMR